MKKTPAPPTQQPNKWTYIRGTIPLHMQTVCLINRICHHLTMLRCSHSSTSVSRANFSLPTGLFPLCNFCCLHTRKLWEREKTFIKIQISHHGNLILELSKVFNAWFDLWFANKRNQTIDFVFISMTLCNHCVKASLVFLVLMLLRGRVHTLSAFRFCVVILSTL